MIIKNRLSVIENHPRDQEPLQIRGNYSYLMGKVSIQPPGSDKVIRFFAAEKPWGELEAPVNSSLRNRIGKGALVPIDIINDVERKTLRVYVKPQKIARIRKAIEQHERNTKALEESLSASGSEDCETSLKNIHELVAEKIFSDREDFQDFDTIEESSSGKLIRHADSWNFVKVEASGAFSKTAVCEKIAFKTLKKATKTKNPSEASERVDRILTRVNPDGTAVGIQKKPISSLSPRTFTVYSVHKGSVRKKTTTNPVQVEEAFKADCFDALKNGLLTKEEIPSIAACLVQGSKAFLANGIYHLDVKLENIGYTGSGTAVHFDLDGALDAQEENWMREDFTRTPGYFREREMNFLLDDLRDKKEESCKRRLEQMHIFQLGMALFLLQTGHSVFPYDLNASINIREALRETEVKLAGSGIRNGGLSPQQIHMIATMLNPDREQRPSIAEIERVFPPSLIRGQDGTASSAR